MTNVEKARSIRPTYDNRGEPHWQSRMTTPDHTFGACFMVPDRVIPVVFVPGVMGSNLRGTGAAVGINWRVDSARSMAAWLTRGPEPRKRFLTPTTMEVDAAGTLPEDTELPAEELRRRGWGEVAAMSYREFLVWLEAALNDFNDPDAGERVGLMSRSLQALVGEAAPTRDEIGLTYRYRFPVHACGYNWLDSNAVAAKLLGQRITQIIARYRTEGKKCEKVILVTHSMGGLVARHCSEVDGYRDKILGVVHGVMPAIGAAAVYRRFKAGTEGAYMASKVLGEDAAEMTAVLSTAPGPLQLLPTAEYGNGWLKIKDRSTEYSLPKGGDPYGEIYTVRGKWWSMCEDILMNPLNDEPTENRRDTRMDSDWAAFCDTIKLVRTFHADISSEYHVQTHAFFGSHRDQRAYGTVTWSGDGGGWLRGDRVADVLGARQVGGRELDESRTVAAQLSGSGWQKAERQSYRISEPDEDGDGTVPHRSGIALRSNVKSLLQVNVGHEPAYKHTEGADNLRACRFTLRAIVKIAQRVASTSLRYK